MTKRAESLQVVDALIDAAVAESTIPGLVLAIVEDGRVVDLVARGTTDAGGTVTVDASTRFRIASMTKSFTAAATLALRDEGVLGLDDVVVAHVPLLASLVPPTSDSPPLTIRHLLTMSAGLATDDAWADRHLGDSPDEMDTLFRAGATFAVAPGVRMDYSNYGYAMLGRVIESATGRRSSDVVTERIIEPLGLTRTTWDLDEIGADQTVAMPHRVVDGVAVHEGTEPLPNGGFAPMGGLWSTAEDLARWIDFMCDAFPPRDGEDRFGAVLSRSSRRELQQVHRAFTAPSLHHGPDGRLRGVGVGYGMGLNRLHHMDLGPVVTHSGGLPGYGSNMRWLPERGVGIVALANVTYAPMWGLTLKVLDALFDSGWLVPTKVPYDDVLIRPAAAALVALLSDWNDEIAGSLFADNVALDEPFERRRDAAGKLIERCGPVSVVELEVLSRTEADAVVRGERGSAKIEIQLSPTVPTRIQWYELVELGESAHPTTDEPAETESDPDL